MFQFIFQRELFTKIKINVKHVLENASDDSPRVKHIFHQQHVVILKMMFTVFFLKKKATITI